MKASHQVLPSAWPQREALREKGQFWTPAWVAEAMVTYVLQGEPDHVFDPAVGGGAFLLAAKAVSKELGRAVELRGTELHREVFDEAKKNGLSDSDLQNIEITDFVLDPPRQFFQAVVANPPYIRHHRLPLEVKGRLQALAHSMLGHTIDRRAGYHVFFLLRALERLAPGGRLAFIMPADTCEGVFARSVWNWITHVFCLDGVVTFTSDASPFPGVDTNAMIFLIRRDLPADTIAWARCRERGPRLKLWLAKGLPNVEETSLYACHRDLDEALSTGLSRAPSGAIASDELALGNVVRVVRGIAAGANSYFFLTHSASMQHGLPSEFLIHAIGRTRDVCGGTLTTETIAELDRFGRPSLLLSLDGRAKDQFPPAVQNYISYGESLGLPERPLIKSRRPWYKMERRQPPPFLFAYLGRRNARFIRNLAGAVPLTGFLCVYPRSCDPVDEDRLWKVLQHPVVVANLSRVGKSYGGGAIKVEPRALEQLPIPRSVLDANGIQPQAQMEQFALAW